ncbi:hypothetical protein Tdes44962_MAKER05916 [Teratosphaeria destructans]|uniref:F-box domain-containing protein n=1 Tax=Teratosphaeria destructans TaxID=418781 RepID=A0A9W7VY32_9PEZI|nr:hypothetical protein Tdes44962_MAKER05916 [Teratosphaeria destructans]
MPRKITKNTATKNTATRNTATRNTATRNNNKTPAALNTKVELRQTVPDSMVLFGVTELTEQILLNLDRREIRRVQSVCGKFQDTIAGSLHLQRKLLVQTSRKAETGGLQIRNLHPLLFGKAMRVGRCVYIFNFLYIARRPGQAAVYYLYSRTRKLRGRAVSCKKSGRDCDLNHHYGEGGSWRQERLATDSTEFVVDEGRHSGIGLQGGSTWGDLVDAVLAREKRGQLSFGVGGRRGRG